MKNKKKKQLSAKVKILDYIKTIKKADREIELERSIGWTAKHKIHKSKKVYDRKANKKRLEE